MVCIDEIHHAPPNSGEVVLGRTLPSLLDEACDRLPNPHAFTQWTDAGWQSLSNQEFRTAVEAITVGLLDLGLKAGDRVALLMHSDIHFCMADLGCLLAHLIDVPIDLTQTIEHILYVLQHSEARALIVSNLELLTQIVPYLWETPQLEFILVADIPPDWEQVRSQWLMPLPRAEDAAAELAPESTCLWIPTFLHATHPHQPQVPFPQCIRLLSLTELHPRQDAETAHLLQQLRSTLMPQSVATLVYIPDAKGDLQGVMLTHENLSSNALAAFSGIPGLKQGEAEVILSFLPLNHVLARTLLYGHINYGHSIYFSNPNRIVRHLKEVQPTIFITVPLLLEKIYSKILEKGRQRRPADMTSRLSMLLSLPFLASLLLFNWAVMLTQQYELGHPPRGFYALSLKLADWLVLSKWRSLFGGRLKHLICGGAALKAELANAFAAAGVPILQGYGLTQASAVVCCNRGIWNRAGTVGVPLPGIEVAIAADQEILIRGHYLTPGYYKNPEATRDLIDAEGWLHTGDLGTFTSEGFLKITGLKKSLFKLLTGKYIVPEPIEQRLNQSPFIAQAIVVGAERKFCGLLVVPDLAALQTHLRTVGIDVSDDEILQHPCVTAIYQMVIDAANCHLPYWATVKRFRLINAVFSIENGLLTSDQRVDRRRVLEVFAQDIDQLYSESEKGKPQPTIVNSEEMLSLAACPPLSLSPCPVTAQSLNTRITL
jgi:long-chain acyl-CoA synthetase